MPLPPKVVAAYEKVKESELFAIVPAPRFERRARYGTTLGLIMSIVLVICGGGYAIWSIIRLLTAENPTITRVTTPQAPPFPMDPFSLSLPRITDRSYFDALVEFRRQAPGERSEKTTLNLIESADGSTLTYSGAGDTDLIVLEGDCRVQRCGYMRVKIYPCQNGTTQTRSGQNVTCKPMEDITAIINSNYMLLVLHSKTQDGEPITRSFELSLKDALSFRQRFPFDVVYTKKYANLLTSFRTQKTRTLAMEAPWFAIDRLPRLKTGEDTEYCKLDFMLTGVEITERRRFPTSLDVIGQIGAFFGALMGVAAFIAVTYNEKKFYSKYPKWTAFDGNFQPMPIPESESSASGSGSDAEGGADARKKQPMSPANGTGDSAGPDTQARPRPWKKESQKSDASGGGKKKEAGKNNKAREYRFGDPPAASERASRDRGENYHAVGANGQAPTAKDV
uniref:Uncharacterized protein n=1 Tax=Neobodo designis TaxID=312471 RepID=A0A7S1M2U9_NEODS|mmetsp:Transcript_32873/g.101601  ORF Transcript_32873/g.101601 Transcript_32873/m.101601 type:complete len:451 (+) Transcript_32873:49-1401(+)